MRLQIVFDQEPKWLERLHQPKKRHSSLLELIHEIEPKMMNKKGKLNWWWILWNIGKIVARIVLASKVQRRMKF